MNKIEKSIAEIKEALDYQGKLIEHIYEILDAAQKSKADLPSIKSIMDIIGSHPLIKNNPAMAGMIQSLFNGAGGQR